jgi:hypothetical protein
MRATIRHRLAPEMIASGDYVYILRGNVLTELSAANLAIVGKAVLEPARPGRFGRARLGAHAGPGGQVAPPHGDQAGPPPPPDARYRPDHGRWLAGHRRLARRLVFRPRPVLTVHGNRVYVLRGHTLFQFSTDGLKPINKVTLYDSRRPGVMRPGARPG